MTWSDRVKETGDLIIGIDRQSAIFHIVGTQGKGSCRLFILMSFDKRIPLHIHKNIGV